MNRIVVDFIFDDVADSRLDGDKWGNWGADSRITWAGLISAELTSNALVRSVPSMPNSFRDHLQQIIQKHVSKAIAGAVEGATREAIAAYQTFVVGSLGDSAPRRGPGRPPKAAKTTPTAKPSKAAKPKTRGRRTPTQIAVTIDRVLSFIDKHPGKRSEQIQKSLGGNRKAIIDALGRLRESKKVKTSGVKRAMTYSL